VPELLPPSRKRVREARALGLRPRTDLLRLAALALLLASSLELWPLAVRWLSDRLASAFAGLLEFDGPGLAAGAGAGLLVMLGVGLLVVVLVVSRRPARQALGVGAEATQLPDWIAITLMLVALGLLLLANHGVLATAARSVDASPEALTHAWLAWVRRGLLALALVAAGVGLIERQLSARQLWRALHQTPAQARAEARAAGRRAPRKSW
jgi:hypothetical protein